MRASTGEDAAAASASVFCAFVVMLVIAASEFINFASSMPKIFCIYAAISVLQTRQARRGERRALPTGLPHSAKPRTLRVMEQVRTRGSRVAPFPECPSPQVLFPPRPGDR